MDSDYVAMSPTDRITAAKAAVALVICLCSFAVGLLPLKFADRWRSPAEREACVSRRPTASSLLLCFGGGVLLFITLLHLQPDVRQSVRLLQDAGRIPEIEHLGDLIFCTGFFAVFAVNEAVIKLRGRGRERRTGPAAVQMQPESFRCVFAVVALAIHETFVGLSLGLQPAGPVGREMCAYTTATANKLIVAFFLSLELAWSGAQKPAIFACSATFAAVTPIGVAFGMAVSQCCNGVAVDQLPGVVPVVSQGLAAGALAFVVFFRRKWKGFTHLLSTVIGFCVMLFLQTATHCQ